MGRLDMESEITNITKSQKFQARAYKVHVFGRWGVEKIRAQAKIREINRGLIAFVAFFMGF